MALSKGIFVEEEVKILYKCFKNLILFEKNGNLDRMHKAFGTKYSFNFFLLLYLPFFISSAVFSTYYSYIGSRFFLISSFNFSQNIKTEQ